ncbi:predicted protein [Sclerotinia sclerotiorum 1980 UF-70]|uniref:Uncharacterized protein n=1 Tax=Sclerotinia sclerotiorum (strain ATCC 18683 / 1980 / Ss-1) TaxID=665079 RepID=A7EBI8_SCLS1|nr:predicted protein [Sclerotinia sclerotiorum 1980 UF-70]EDN99816.1 predicted protein [Sclerotinia sclerotiorum 1980 UF-70]
MCCFFLQNKGADSVDRSIPQRMMPDRSVIPQADIFSNALLPKAHNIHAFTIITTLISVFLKPFKVSVKFLLPAKLRLNVLACFILFPFVVFKHEVKKNIVWIVVIGHNRSFHADLMPTISGPADAEMQSLDISDQRAALLFESAVNFSRRFFRSVCLEDPRKYIAVNHVCR